MVSRKDLLAGIAAVPQVEAASVPQLEAGVNIQVGLAWYRREDYARIRDLMDDRKDLHDTYDEWLRDSERVERHLVNEGKTVERIMIDPDTFRAWCELRGLRPRAKARSRYTAEATRGRSS